MKRGLFALALVLAALPQLSVAAAASVDKPPLREVAEIDDPLMHVAIADALRKRCDDISARMIRAYFYLERLKRRARELGYSDEEIKAYVTSREEKDRMRQKAEAFLASQGVNPDDNSEFCAYGREQIEKGTLIGSLLRAK